MINLKESEIKKNWIENKLPLVSIRCITFNQKDYISQALDSFLMQKTNFPFEIVVHDDASTDGTSEIIQEYEKKFPSIIKPIYETENQWSKHDGSLAKIVNSACRGKYISLCEGDDFWCDDHKLQKQINILEKNPKCTLVLSNGFSGPDFDHKKIINPYGKKRSGYLNSRTFFLSKGGLVPTASMTVRKEFVERPEILKKSPVGDKPMRMWCFINGPVYYIAKPMAFYRACSSGSFSQNISGNLSYAKNVYEGFTDFLNRFDEYTSHKYSYEVEYMKQKEEYYYYKRIRDYDSAEKCPFMSHKENKSFKKTVKKILKQFFPKFYKFLKEKKSK